MRHPLANAKRALDDLGPWVPALGGWVCGGVFYEFQFYGGLVCGQVCKWGVVGWLVGLLAGWLVG
jgi:hypothetical protein